MKLIVRLLTVAVLIVFSTAIHAQTKPVTTFIILRHAEKDTVGTDPQLSVAGKARAERLPVLFKDVKPDLMYSTPYVRTRQTLMPWAKKNQLEIKEYNPADLAGFADGLRSIEGKTIVVVGHSNTAPVLVNLLICSNKYSPLNDNDYSTLWVVELKDGIATEKLVKY